MEWYLKVLRNYAEFNGRARRKEYWMYVLFYVIFGIIVMMIDNIFGTTIENLGYGMFYILYVIAFLIPGLAVTVRRLHDTGRSGWWLLMGFIPVIGSIWLLVLLVLDSDPGANEYGPNPK